MHSGIPYSRTGKFQGISLAAGMHISCMPCRKYCLQKQNAVKNFRDALLESRDQKLAETVRSDRFWSCGLTPSEAQTTKHIYHPGENHLGRLLELVRAHLIKQIQNDKKDEQSMPTTSSTLARYQCAPPYSTITVYKLEQ